MQTNSCARNAEQVSIDLQLHGNHTIVISNSVTRTTDAEAKEEVVPPIIPRELLESANVVYKERENHVGSCHLAGSHLNMP